jgi:hypothetical protein
LAGFLIIFIAIGAVLGIPLMGATIALEGTDAFDAISRAYSYVFSRPWKLLWYWLVSLAYGIAVTAFVIGFTYAMVGVAIKVGGWAMGANFLPTHEFVCAYGGSLREATIGQTVCAILVKFWLIITWGLVCGYVVAYKLTMSTIIYALLRKSVDGTDMTEVYLEEEEEEFEIPAAQPTATEEKTETTPPAEDKKTQ